MSRVPKAEKPTVPPHTSEPDNANNRSDTTLATRMGSNIAVGSIPAFDVDSPGSWSDYCDDLDVFFSTNRIDQESQVIQRSTFCSVIGSAAFKLLRTIIAPYKYTEQTVEQLRQALTNHFAPKQSVVLYSHRFFTRLQRQGETANQYLAALRAIADHCEYEAMLDRLIRDRFISGVRDTVLQRRLLEDQNITLQLAIERANAYEQALVSSDEVKSSASQLTSQLDIKHTARALNRRRSVSRNRRQFRNSQSSSRLQSPHQSRSCAGCLGSHPRAQCPFLKVICRTCKKKGHISTACRSRSLNNVNTTPALTTLDHDSDDLLVASIRAQNNPPSMVTVRINGYSLQMEIDTGAAVTIVSRSTYCRINQVRATPLEPFKGTIRGVSGNTISVLGCADVNVQYRSINTELPLIVSNNESPNLLGRDWFYRLEFFVGGINHVDCPNQISTIFTRHAPVFEPGLGEYRGEPIHLELDPNVKPLFCKPRRVPLGIVDKVNTAIDKLIEDGVYVPVNHTQWGTPLVPVIKADGSIRLCADYKITINKALRPHPHPIPVISHLLTNLRGGNVFAKLDLAQAYLQLKVNYQSSLLQTVVTHRGAFRVTRLQFGVSTAPGEFQAVIDKLLTGIDGIAAYFDDIVVAAENVTQLSYRLDQVLSRLSTVGLRLRPDKCVLFTNEVKFLGYIISSKGLKPDPELCAAVHKAPAPTNKKELQAFLGLLNFFHTFLSNKATVAEPLHRLLEKQSRWKWTAIHQNAFVSCKRLLSADSVLSHFNPRVPIVLICDASPVGIGAVLCHRKPDGSELPVAYFSRSLSSAERNYAQIDREALAIIAGVRKFHHFLFGFSFEIVTDHKPLLGLFDSCRQTPEILSPRMLRWSVMLAVYKYRIIHRPGKQIPHADALSRLPLSVPKVTSTDLTEIFLLEHDGKLPITATDIATETRKDSDLSKVYSWAVTGWPHANAVPLNLRCYSQHRNVISTYKGCLLYGTRTIVPPSSQKYILDLLHVAHPGMTRMKAIARNYAWWPTINNDVEEYVRNCSACQMHQSASPSVPAVKWSKPPTPWYRIHVDYAGPFKGRRFLLVVDALTKWLEVREVSTVNPINTIICLRSIFATHGVPAILVSDNDKACFDTLQFELFCRSNAVRHVRTAPYHPQSNGQIERMVQTTKRSLEKIMANHSIEKDEKWKQAIDSFLLSQHVTPLTPDTLSPSELLFRRRLRTRLDAINPVNNPDFDRQESPNIKRSRSFSSGEAVYARNYGTGPRWVPATVLAPRSAVTYDLSTSNGTPFHRHTDQLRPRLNEQSSVATNQQSSEDDQSISIPDETVPLPPLPDQSSSPGSPMSIQAPLRTLPDRAAKRKVRFPSSDDSLDEANDDPTYSPSK